MRGFAPYASGSQQTGVGITRGGPPASFGASFGNPGGLADLGRAAGVSMDLPAMSEAQFDDHLRDAGTTCTVGACGSEVDIPQSFYIETIAIVVTFTAPVAFAIAAPEAAVMIGVALTQMSSGPSDLDVAVGVAYAGTRVAGRVGRARGARCRACGGGGGLRAPSGLRGGAWVPVRVWAGVLSTGCTQAAGAGARYAACRLQREVV
jgi:hypothetical protein